MYVADKDKCNFYHQWLCVQSEIGKISHLIVVNAHRYNYIPPEKMKESLAELRRLLNIFEARYAEEYQKMKSGLVDMEH